MGLGILVVAMMYNLERVIGYVGDGSWGFVLCAESKFPPFTGQSTNFHSISAGSINYFLFHSKRNILLCLLESSTLSACVDCMIGSVSPFPCQDIFKL